VIQQIFFASSAHETFDAQRSLSENKFFTKLRNTFEPVRCKFLQPLQIICKSERFIF